MKQLINIGFIDYQLKEILLDVLEFNFPALKIYAQRGFLVLGQSGCIMMSMVNIGEC